MCKDKSEADARFEETDVVDGLRREYLLLVEMVRELRDRQTRLEGRVADLEGLMVQAIKRGDRHAQRFGVLEAALTPLLEAVQSLSGEQMEVIDEMLSAKRDLVTDDDVTLADQVTNEVHQVETFLL